MDGRHVKSVQVRASGGLFLLVFLLQLGVIYRVDGAHKLTSVSQAENPNSH
jgi:hypothetical protein